MNQQIEGRIEKLRQDLDHYKREAEEFPQKIGRDPGDHYSHIVNNALYDVQILLTEPDLDTEKLFSSQEYCVVW